MAKLASFWKKYAIYDVIKNCSLFFLSTSYCMFIFLCMYRQSKNYPIWYIGYNIICLMNCRWWWGLGDSQTNKGTGQELSLSEIPGESNRGGEIPGQTPAHLLRPSRWGSEKTALESRGWERENPAPENMVLTGREPRQRERKPPSDPVFV